MAPVIGGVMSFIPTIDREKHDKIFKALSSCSVEAKNRLSSDAEILITRKNRLKMGLMN